jgi:hypothetical protein
VISYDAHQPRLSTRFRLQIGRLASRPAGTIRRLEQDAVRGESARALAILVAAVAMCMWTLVAILVATALIAAALLTR